nr:hypothetical protein [Tanacetum cinerariifolium]
GISGTQELSPTDSLIPDDSIPNEQVHFSDDENSRNDHIPKANSRNDWWKPLPKEERPRTPKPAWTIPSFNFQMEECYKMLTDQVDWTNPEGDQVRVNVNRPLPLGGPPGSSPALTISKMKTASYPDFGLELLVPKQMWIDDVCTYDISANMASLTAYSRYGYDYLSEIILQRDDLQEHTIAKKDFKNLYPSDFEDLNLLLLQGHLDHLLGSDKRMLSTAVKLWTRNLVIQQRVEDFQLDVFPVNNNERKIMRFNEIYKFSDGTLTRILEALAYRVKEFKIKRLNPGIFVGPPLEYLEGNKDTMKDLDFGNFTYGIFVGPPLEYLEGNKDTMKDLDFRNFTYVSIAGTFSTEQPPLKDKYMWSDQEKKIQKIDHLARSLLIQGLPNDIYSLIDSNKTAKDLWDVLARDMLGSEYREQDRKAAVLYEYETFKATEGELFLDTYI